MIAENVVDPERLLEQYKKYEYVLNVDEKKLKKELFNYKPPVVIEAEVVKPKKKIEVIETPRSGETGADGEEVKAAEPEPEPEEVYVKPEGKQILADIKE